MGQCYSIELRVRFTDERAATAAMQQKMERAKDERINYNLPQFTERGVDLDDAFGLLRVVFADWPRNDYTRHEPDADGITIITNNFDASYGWHQVMSDFFELLAPYLADGSSLDIWPDSGHDYMTISNHKFIQH